jgi:hypothetical protein
VSPVTRAAPRALRDAFPASRARRGAVLTAGCVISVLILDSGSADSAMGIPLFLLSAQVRGLTDRLGSCGQGQDRTVDLPLFRRSVAPDATG